MKKILTAMLILSIVVGLTACGDKGPTKEDLQKQNETLTILLQEDEAKIKSYEETLKGLSDGEVKTAIGKMSDGSELPTFNTIQGKVIFPVPFEYTGATPAPNSTSLRVTDNVSIVPSSNWLIKMNGSTTEFSHPDKISGIVKVGLIQEAIKTDTIQNVIFKPLIEKMPNAKASYGTLFLAGVPWGQYANVTTTVDSTPATIKMGALGVGNNSLTYMFIYKSKDDATKNELIDTLIKTIKVNNQQLSLN